jgi:uncharacterized membrane protein
MGIESSLFSVLILVGGIFVFAGMLTAIFPPKKINYLYGYRTISSMKSQENWDFSQKYATRLLILIGLFLSVIATFGLFISFSERIDFGIAMALVLASVFFLLIKTERAIEKKFPKN